MKSPRHCSTRIRSGAVGFLLLFAAASVGCGGAARQLAFGHRFPDNRPEDLQAVLRRLPPPTVPSGPANTSKRPLLVGTTATEPRSVVAMDLGEGRVLWSRPLEALTRPEVAGDVVVTSDREAVVALDLATGAPLWRAETNGLPLVGATRAGRLLVYVLSVGAAGGATRVGRIAAVDARSGSEAWSFSVQGVLGRPAAADGFVFVPWDRQNLAILEAETGRERARLLLTDDVLDWVFASPAGVYYGGKGIYRLSARSASGRKVESDYVQVPVPDAPRDPLPFDPAFLPAPGTRSARGRIRFYFAPAPPTAGAPVRPLGDRYYFVYFRYVFAFDPDGRLGWARALPRDIVRAQASEAGLLAVPEAGEAVLLAASDGTVRWRAELPVELASAELDADGLPAADRADEQPVPVRDALRAIVTDSDNRLVPARVFAVGRLAAIDEGDVTADLLAAYEQRAMPRALKKAIAEALRRRDRGSEHLVAALRRHYDFLEATRVPPFEAIVPAVEAHGVKDAVPLLVEHLWEPATPTERLPLLAGAIARLGGKQGIEALHEFLRRYRADSSLTARVPERVLRSLPPLPWVPEACFAPTGGAGAAADADQRNAEADACPEAKRPTWLQYVVQVIFEHGDDAARTALAQLVDRAGTDASVKAAHEALLARVAAAEEARKRAEEEARRRAEEEARRRAARERPVKLSQQQINAVFLEHAEALSKCVEGELERRPRLAFVRLAFIVERDGSAHDFRVVPDSDPLRTCLAPVLAELRFPPFKQRRQRGTFTMVLRGEQAAPKGEEESEARPWWALSASRPGPVVGEGNPPWWRPGERPPAEAPSSTAPSGGQGAGAPWWLEQGGGAGAEGGGQAPPSETPPPGPSEDGGGSADRPGRQPAASDGEAEQPGPPTSQEDGEGDGDGDQGDGGAEEPPPPPEEDQPWWLPTQG